MQQPGVGVAHSSYVRRLLETVGRLSLSSERNYMRPAISQLGCRRLIKVARTPSSMSTVLCFTGIHWHNLKVHFEMTNSKQHFFINIDMSVKVLNSSRRN